MRNLSKAKIKELSDYMLSERLDGLCSVKARLCEYSHVFEMNETLLEMIQDEIDNICDEQDKRLSENYYEITNELN
jgi:hypothetical protein